METFKALAYINLPVIEVKKEPGDLITGQEFNDANQTPDDIQLLIDSGALSSDLDAELHEDYRYIFSDTLNTDNNIFASDAGNGV